MVPIDKGRNWGREGDECTRLTTARKPLIQTDTADPPSPPHPIKDCNQEAWRWRKAQLLSAWNWEDAEFP